MSNRVINFRIWDKEYKEMLYDPVHMLSTEGRAYCNYETGKIKAWPKDTYVIMQFTGLLDKNSKEIYEGDILEITLLSGFKYLGEVKWDQLRVTYCLEYSWGNRQTLSFFADNILPKTSEYTKIIGNIYENPELLAKNEQ